MFGRVPAIAIAAGVAVLIVVVAVLVALATGGLAPHCTAPSGSAACASPTASP